MAVRLIEAIGPPVPVRAIIRIEPIKMPVIAIGSSVSVRVGAESIKITVRIVIVPVVIARISRTDTYAVIETRAAAAR